MTARSLPVRLRARRGLATVAVGLVAVGLAVVGAPAAVALPDGYRYEMISPPDKQGGRVTASPLTADGWGTGNIAISGSGERIIYTSLQSFGDAVSNPMSSFYLASRTPNSWTSLNFTPFILSRGYQGITESAAPIAVSRTLDSAIVYSTTDPTTRERQPRLNLYFNDLSTGRYRQLTPDPVAGPTDYTLGPSDLPGSPLYIVSGATPDLSRIVYLTTAQLTEDAPSSGEKAYVVETATGEVTLASVLGGSPGTPTAINSSAVLGSRDNRNALSADGSKVFFLADGMLRMRDLDAGVTRDLAEATVSGQEFQQATPDGRYVFVLTTAQLVAEDVNSGPDLYRLDTSAVPGFDPVLISADSEPADGSDGAAIGTMGASDDGSRVYFTTGLDGYVGTGEQLVAGGPTDSNTYVYLWDDGELSLVGAADMSVFDYAFTQDRRQRAQTVDVSPSGRYVVFQPGGNLLDEDAAVGQVYLYDAEASGSLDSKLECISCLPDPRRTPESGALATDPSYFDGDTRHYVTDDGRAAFQTASALLPADTNGGKLDAYTYKDGRLDLVSTGRDPGGSVMFGMDATGRSIFFAAGEPISGWDIDGAPDAYVARLGGGLPEPPPARPGCVDDECQGAPSGGPSAASSASSGYLGAGNARGGRSPRRCQALSSRARSVSLQAQRLQRRASRTSGAKAKRLRRAASKAQAKAKQAKRQARRCTLATRAGR